ncbi:MAG: C-type lectin domain-containing protein [Candidatus Peribacter sp.]|nr:C-type lectin domain-containing protein [Candidatus Peribacter sp.]
MANDHRNDPWKNLAFIIIIVMVVWFGAGYLSQQKQDAAPTYQQAEDVQIPQPEAAQQQPASRQPITELQFEIEGQYLGQGEIKTSVKTNLWPGTEVTLYAMSISRIYPDDMNPPDDYGFDASRAYSLYSIALKNQPITDYVPGGSDIMLSSFDHPMTVLENGEAQDSFLLFQPEALQHSLKDVSKQVNDGNLLTQLQNRQALELDQKVILSFEIREWRMEEDNFGGIKIDTIQLPDNCTSLTGQKYGQTWHMIRCLKEISIPKATIALDRTNGVEKQRQAIAEREAAECSILTNKYCYFYFNRQGNVTWQEANSKCSELGGELPPKADLTTVREQLATLYAANSNLIFVWASETKANPYNGEVAYGWVEGFIKNDEGDYRRDWATANSDKRDYVTFVCVKKR